MIDSDEHDESGHITEDLDVRDRMVQKRLHRHADVLRDVDEPLGMGRGNVLLIGWGSSFGALEELVERYPSDLRLIHYSEVWPLRTERLLTELEHAGTSVAVEGNATGQFARLIAQETGKQVAHRVARYDGRPLTVANIEARRRELEVL